MFRIKKLCFVPAGVPLSSSDTSTISGLKRVKELNLDGMEMEFVQGVRMSEKTAIEIGKFAEGNHLVLTAHGPYFINLNAKEKEKVEKSIERIYQTAKIAHIASGYSITFHAGFYFQDDREIAYRTARDNLSRVIEKLKSEKIEIWVRPELTGKKTQIGSFEELLKFSSELDQVMPCIDFAHYVARENGLTNDEKYFRYIFDGIEKNLGKAGLENMHIHMSGINYSEKGERNHLNLQESSLKWKKIIELLHEYNVKGVVVSESPNIEKDAILMKTYYNSLK
ncbi:MAG: TIM barrel protein [Candidatus Woesearchaeota archaeon]